MMGASAGEPSYRILAVASTRVQLATRTTARGTERSRTRCPAWPRLLSPSASRPSFSFGGPTGPVIDSCSNRPGVGPTAINQGQQAGDDHNWQPDGHVVPDLSLIHISE